MTFEAKAALTFIFGALVIWILICWMFSMSKRIRDLEAIRDERKKKERIADEAERKLSKRRIVPPYAYLDFSKPQKPLTQAEIDRIRSEWEESFGSNPSSLITCRKEDGITVPVEDKL